MPTIGVDVVILSEKQVLLTMRNDFPIWCLPGGGVDDGESLAKAAVREAKEETGLLVQLNRLVGVYSRSKWWNGGGHAVVFSGMAVGGELGKFDNEVSNVQYFDIDKFPSNLLWWHKQCIKDATDSSTIGAWSQNAVWPYPDLTREKAFEYINTGLISKEEIVYLFCNSPNDQPDTLEVG